MNYDRPTERGAETIRCPGGIGYSLAVCDWEQEDGSIKRTVTLLHVDTNDRDTVLFDTTEDVDA